MKEKEVWKVWHNGPKVIWEVSDWGRVKKNGVPHECRLTNRGYKIFVCRYSVHKAVAELFIPNPNNYNEVDHINGNKLDNRAINLQWCSHKENMNNPITRNKISESMKGKNKGKILGPQSEETRKKRSESMKGPKNPNYSKPQSEESNKKRSKAMKNTHRVYHNDGTWHMEKNIIIN